MTGSSRNKLLLVSFFFLFLVACAPQPVPSYSFETVYGELRKIDASFNTSFLNESIEVPIDNATIASLLVKVGELRENNEHLSFSEDHDAIALLLDSRENLLRSQERANIFLDHFNGRYHCDDAWNDRLALAYLDEAVAYGIKANAKMDSLLSSSETAREIILKGPKPVFYSSDYGRFSIFSDDYKTFLSQYCSGE